MKESPEKPTPSRPRSAPIANVALLIFSLALVLLLCEAGLRLMYPRLADYDTEMWRYFAEMKEPFFDANFPFHHFPNRKGEYYGVEIATNSYGFRDAEYPLTRIEDTTRIMMLGDSMTLGWGVPEADTFSSVLEDTLNREGRRAEVINLGIGNYNSRMEVELLKRKGLQFEPDIIVLTYFVNDAESVPQISRFRYETRKHSYLLAFLFKTIVRFRTNIDKNYEWDSYYTNLYSADSESLNDNTEALRELQQLCQNNGIALLIVNIPELRNLDDYPLHIATDYIKNLAATMGVPFFDTHPSLTGHDAESLWVSKEDPHASVKAHRIIAAGIQDTLAREDMLPSPSK